LIGNRSSKTWHALPQQESCNACHGPGRHAIDYLQEQVRVLKEQQEKDKRILLNDQ